MTLFSVQRVDECVQEEARDSGGHSEQLYCDDDGGVGGAGKITEDRVNAGKRFKSQAEFLTELDKEFEKKVIDGLEAGLRLKVKEKLATNIQLIPKENNAIVNSVLQNIFDQYGPVKPDIKLCESSGAKNFDVSKVFIK